MSVFTSWDVLKVIDTRNPEVCSSCGGDCCKGYSGPAWPEQFGAPDKAALLASLTTALRSGRWAVDCWEGFEGDSNGWFIRPAHKNAIGKVFDYSWGGECVFLSKSGCELHHSNRPAVCRDLVPNEKYKKDGIGCKLGTIGGNGKYEAALVWAEYADVIGRATGMVGAR